MRNETNKYSAWIVGYFDDFNAGRCISDDENTPNTDLTYVQADTHHGNHMNGEARLNPRYKKAQKDRADGDETHNTGAHNFLTTDTIRDNEELWEGKAQVSYPDGLAQPNRIPYDKDTNLGSYLLVSNGYNNSGMYSIHLGATDATNGRGTVRGRKFVGGTGNYDGSEGLIGSGFEIQYAHLCGVHMGEISPDGDSSHNAVSAGLIDEPYSKAILEPIESIAGKPFLSITSHIIQVPPMSAPNRLISYNGNIGATTDNDTFGVRMAWRGVNNSTIGTFGSVPASQMANTAIPSMTYIIKVGFAKNNYTENGGFTGAHAAAYNFTTSKRSNTGTITEATGLKSGYVDRHPWAKFTENPGMSETTNPSAEDVVLFSETNRTYELNRIWNDFEFTFNFTAGTYNVLHDGVVVALNQVIGTNPDTGNKFTAEELHGWELLMEASSDDGNSKVSTLIDRAYLCRDLSNGLTTTLENMSIKYRSNGISSCTINITDDSEELSLFPGFKSTTHKMQELIIFRDGIDIPLWRGHIENLTASQKRNERTMTLTARDYLAALDRSLPIWEIGQSNNINEGEPEGWRPYESTNFIEKMHFGASKLERANATLGVKAPNYLQEEDTRARLNSAHPIQMYNEEGGGPEEIYEQRHTAHLQGFEKPSSTYANPQSLTNPLKVHCRSHGLSQGDSVTITDTTSYNGTYTANDPSTDYFYIDKAYVATGYISGIHNGKNKGAALTGSGSQRTFIYDFASQLDATYSGTTICVSEETGPNDNGDFRLNSKNNPATSTNTDNAAGLIKLLTHTNTVGSGYIRWSSDVKSASAYGSVPALMNLHDAGQYSISTFGYYSSSRASRRVYDNGQDFAHTNGSTGGSNITRVYFMDNTQATNLYVGAYIRITLGTAVNVPADGVGVFGSHFEVTDISGLASSPFYVDVTYAGTTGFPVGAGPNITLTQLNAATVGTDATVGGLAGWALIDKPIPYSVETGQATLPNNLPATLEEDLQLRSIHSRWIQDMPRSNWFKKRFGVIEKVPAATATTNSNKAPGSYTSGQTITVTGGFSASGVGVSTMATQGGVGEFVNADGSVDSFTFTGLGGLSGGAYYSISGAKYFTQKHASGTTINLRTIKNDYKHIWVLWADMRNDGNANADGGSRKNSFGLQFPTSSEYSLTLEYVDQQNVDGEPVPFTELSIGEDVDIWELDSEKEPDTQAAWSALPGASNSDLDSTYHNWENKAGAFIIIDTSKFWNLNTEANAGRTGQTGGGRTDLQDYIAVGTGTPILMDNYWVEGMNTYKNTQAPVTVHPESLDFIHDASLLAADYTGVGSGVNGCELTLDSVADWDDSGVGRIYDIQEGTNGAGKTVLQYYYSWNGRDISANKLHNVNLRFVPGGQSITNTTTRQQIIDDLWRSANGNSMSGTQPNLIISQSESITAYNTVAPINSLRFMMRLSGIVKSTNSGTYFEHDKIRFLNLTSLMKSWLGRSHTTGISDICNVPITQEMSTDASWNYSASSNTDNFGSIVNAKGSSYLGALQKIKGAAGKGEDNKIATFTYQMGPDSRVELRPGFSSFHKLTRDTMKVSAFKSSVQSQITNVRVYFNKQRSFTDYPTTQSSENIRWQILDLPEVGSLEEANFMARQYYEKAQKSLVSIDAEVLRMTDSDVMLSGATYGYISDPARHGYDGANWWTSRQGSGWFPGMVNAMDGKKGTSQEVSGDVASSDYFYFYGANSIANAIQIVHTPKNFPKMSNSTGNKLRFGIFVNGFESGTKTDLKTAAELVKFRLVIFDPLFVDNVTRTQQSAPAMGFAAYQSTFYDTNILESGYSTLNNTNFRTIEEDLENGYREVTIPASYWADSTAPTLLTDRKIVVSINKEYLKALVRNRCGTSFADIGTNAHSSMGITVSSPNTHSIFPLGFREYDRLKGMGEERAVWYAPRLNVRSDINYRVSTALKYSDSAFGYTDESLIINTVDWTVGNLGYERVLLKLATDESTFMPGISSFSTPSGTPTKRAESTNGGGLVTSGRGGIDEPTPDSGEKGGAISPPALVQGGSAGFTGLQVNNKSGQLTTGGYIGANLMTAAMTNKIKGKMDLPGGTSNHSLLGSKRQLPPSISSRFLEGNQDTLTPTSGTATISSDGFAFPGVMSASDAVQPEVSEYQILQSVPSDAASQTVRISIKASVPVISSEEEGVDEASKVVVLYCNVKCRETGSEKSSSIEISTEIADNTSINIFSDTIVGGQTEGNTLEISLYRQPTIGNDNADFKTLKVHSVLTEMARYNLPEDSTSARFGF